MDQNPPSTVAPLIFAVNRGFMLPLEKALRSLAKVYTEAHSLAVHVIHADEFTESDVAALQNALSGRQNISLTMHKIAAFSTDTGAEINNGAYLRLEIPRIFADYERVIYLDADIVFIKSPYDFVRLPLDEKYIIAAIQDVQNPTLGSGIALPGWKDLGLSADQKYFNSGVMIISPERWTQARITEQTIEFVQKRPQHLRFRDQDALNYLLRGQWQTLPLKWNYPPLSAILKVPGAKYYAEAVFPLQQMLDGEQSAAIFHFVGPDKPWNEGFPACPVTDLYNQLTT